MKQKSSGNKNLLRNLFFFQIADTNFAVSGPGPVCYHEASILLRLAEFVELVPEKPLEPFNPNKTKESIAVTDLNLFFFSGGKPCC